MTVLERRRDRLVHVLDLARMYRGWTRQEVAAALGREPSKMIPESGNPKLDLVMGIARLLEWPVGEVAECLWGDRLVAPSPDDFERIGVDGARQTSRAHGALGADRDPCSGAIRYGRALLDESRLRRRDGRYQQAIELLQRGLMLPNLPRLLRAEVQISLAEEHCTLWHLAEARSLASEVLRWANRDEIGDGGPGIPSRHGANSNSGRTDGLDAGDLAWRRQQARALAVRGHSLRRSIAVDPALAPQHAAAALRDLEAAERAASELGLAALTHRAAGGLVECRVELRLIEPDTGVAAILESLDGVIDLDFVDPELVEAWGWWCIFGANVVRRHLRGAAAQRTLGILANKAMEIAERIGDWALRERAFSLDHERGADDGVRDDTGNRRASLDDGISIAVGGDDDAPPMLDHDDIRSIIGTMGRFPHFRETGWALLRRATLIE